ncbi:hypothetical protein [Thalassolituus hydrocarboniclasticus]|uniref:Uncharacterized protein n=1 Tax=Thalassolituus hydrocarboniclasticus TaxID=2742796 RepID=A0ABY6A415_9GAMM|nr:hypothetical protein [Thalassolituus hydrocarboniclasticus]UXD85966.1 hypothetical protein HUF19_00200 [Thalassolituus hydrocarboniclasticus]
MIRISLAVAALTAASAATAQTQYGDYRDLSYTSYTLRQTAWSPEQYVGDLKELVEFGDALAHVVEFRSPRNNEFSFDLAAAVRTNADGKTELESFVGAVEAGGVFFRLESGSAEGYIHPKDRDTQFNGQYIIGERKFDAEYTQLNIGTEVENNMGARWGLGYIEVSQPAQINIYTARSEGGYTDQPSYPDALVDPEYTTRLIGLWFDVDNLQAAMHDQSGFALSLTESGGWRYGPGLTMDMTVGLMTGESSADLERVVKDNYGLNLEYEEPVGMGWSVSYKLEYIVAYRMPGSNIGMSFGLEGRVLQQFFTTEDLSGAANSVDSNYEAVGQFGIGDNTVFHYGPFVRLAWEI